MLRAILFKEWVKTRWIVLVAGAVMLGFVFYTLLNMNRIIGIKGSAHIWEVMILRDAVFVDILQFLPLIVGTVLALFQFVPEVYHKCLKLTLHLPCREMKLVGTMQLYGVGILFIYTLLSLGAVWLFMQNIFARELCQRVLLTALPWYMAGFAAYLLMSWICIEPAWKRRIGYLVVSGLLLKIYFFYPGPEAYTQFMPWLFAGTALLLLLMGMSVARFKMGKQD